MSEPISIDPAALQSIKSALKTWDRVAAASRVLEADEVRKEFVSAYPLEDWPTLPVSSYALGMGTDTKTVCWWLEFGSRKVASMSGGSASKHILFRRPDGTWSFPKEFSTIDDAWEAVRSAFVAAFEFTRTDQIEEIFSLEALYRGPALRTKALYMYFPDKILPVCSSTHLNHFIERLGLEYSRSWVLGANQFLLQALRAIPELDDLSNQELMYFLYHWADPRNSVRVFKIAPGELAKYWDDCLTGSYICVGWDEVGDLSAFASKEAFRDEFRKHNPYNGSEPQVSRKANELWRLMEFEPGDKIVANKGISEILAIGTVNEGGYLFRDDRADFKHTLSVDWDTSVARKINPVETWRTTTVAKISAALYREIFGGNNEPTVDDDAKLLQAEDALRRRKQVIFYGPPGTGKTHIARRAAVWLLEGGSNSSTSAIVISDKEKFDEREKQLTEARERSSKVWFMVANAKQWSWDDMFDRGKVEFSYGRLQRNYPNIRVGDLVVGYQSTPTKRAVALARVVDEFDPDQPDGSLVLEPLSKISDGPTYEDLQSDDVLKESEPMRFRCQGTLFALSATEGDRLLAMIAERDVAAAPHAETSVARLTHITFHPSFTYEDFVEGYRPVPNDNGGLNLELVDGVFKRVCAAAASEPEKSFVLVIDEINRGNIPKIFGELITLIESDKRGFSIRLAQSGEKFNVPSNLYIIGTMNTADRSIQLLDTALRRRFSFIELLPDSEVLDGVTINGLALGQFLESLNEAIRSKVGRERQIGHALFFEKGEVITTPEAFASIFRNELLPLLQEYLYDDYSQLADMLGPLIDGERELVTSAIEDPAQLIEILITQFGASETP